MRRLTSTSVPGAAMPAVAVPAPPTALPPSAVAAAVARPPSAVVPAAPVSPGLGTRSVAATAPTRPFCGTPSPADIEAPARPPSAALSSAMRASNSCSICAGGCSSLSACQRLRAAALSPRDAAANPPYEQRLRVRRRRAQRLFEQLRRRGGDVAAGAKAHGLAQPQRRLHVGRIEPMRMIVGEDGIVQAFERDIGSSQHQPAGRIVRSFAQVALELAHHGLHIRRRALGCGRIPIPVGPQRIQRRRAPGHQHAGESADQAAVPIATQRYRNGCRGKRSHEGCGDDEGRHGLAWPQG